MHKRFKYINIYVTVRPLFKLRTYNKYVYNWIRPRMTHLKVYMISFMTEIMTNYILIPFSNIFYNRSFKRVMLANNLIMKYSTMN